MAEESNAMYYSVDNLNTLSEDLNKEAQNFANVIEAMYTEIAGMETNNYWKGATYTQFKSMCDTFRSTKINAIITKLEGWSKGFADIAVSASETTTKNKEVFDNIL